MSEAPLIDREARERFRDEWDANFAVSANAGSGKTTAISERLAALALSPTGAERLRKTAVVTYTRKAAAQIEQRARQVLMRRITERGSRDLAPLDYLERAFFGTIHSFCLKLAQTYGQTVGINLNPTVVADDDEALWEEFLEQDGMQFAALAPAQIDAFLRHAPLDAIFDLARELPRATAEEFVRQAVAPAPPEPDAVALREILAATSRGKGAEALQRNQAVAREWLQQFRTGQAYLPLPKPEGSAAGIKELYSRFFAPVKTWLAVAGAVLAAELSARYRAWRFTRGVQTYVDQVDAAMAVLDDDALLERVRAEGWRIILDEAQDTDPQQFAVLVELTRPSGAPRGTWPRASGQGVGPRPGHFCMVGDGQQAIYSTRADIGKFSRHVEAFRRGDGGELLQFQVTFRAPHGVIRFLNSTLPVAFGPGRDENFGLPPAEGAPAPFLQMPYVQLEAGPANEPGLVARLALALPARAPAGVEAWLTEEARQVAEWLHRHGPAAVGARRWGDIAILAPRNEWLSTARKALERAGLQVALHTRRNRSGDHPVYAWLAGLLAVCADPENTFEWVGVLREIFGVSDALIAAELHAQNRLAWDEPAVHAPPLAEALGKVRPFVLRMNDEGRALETFARELAGAAALAERAAALDPTGGLGSELDRLLAQAAELGLEGASPRAWLAELLAQLEDGRPAGKPTDDAINLLTSHSAKGLEWPVIIVLGLWRGIGKPPESGLKLLHDAKGAQVYFDPASLPAATKESRERERVRELIRLLYVTLTRPRRALVLPWAEGFGGTQRDPTFANLWGANLGALAELTGEAQIEMEPLTPVEPPRISVPPVEVTSAAAPLPARVLPHQLAQGPDAVRGARHETGLDAPAEWGGDDPIPYGLWWHETMEFLPWRGDEAAVTAHAEAALRVAAAQGFGARAAEEWGRLRSSAVYPVLRHPRWTRRAEIGIFAPLRADAWIDGVIDLVLHDAAAGEIWVLDWKTNRRRAGETDAELLARLVAEYTPQLAAYGDCLAGFFPGSDVRRLVFSTVAGAGCDTSGVKF